MLTAEGRAFTDHYYPKYLDAYNDVFEAEPDYGVEDTAAAYDRIAPVLDQAYQTWIAVGRPAPEPEDPNRVIATPAFARGSGVPDSMTKAELDAYMDAAFQDGNLEMVRVSDLERPHVAPDLERLVVQQLGLAASEVSSVPAAQWGSSLLNRALKRLGVRPRDAVVVSALIGDGEGTVMFSMYAVPGIATQSLRPSSPRPSTGRRRETGNRRTSPARG